VTAAEGVQVVIILVYYSTARRRQSWKQAHVCRLLKKLCRSLVDGLVQLCDPYLRLYAFSKLVLHSKLSESSNPLLYSRVLTYLSVPAHADGVITLLAVAKSSLISSSSGGSKLD